MSTIVSSFVKDRASAAQLPTASLISGAAKAWVSFNQQTTQAILASFNTASISDSGLGSTTVTLTSPFATLTGYSLFASGAMTGSYTSVESDALIVTAASFVFRHVEGATVIDTNFGNISAFGALA